MPASNIVSHIFTMKQKVIGCFSQEGCLDQRTRLFY